MAPICILVNINKIFDLFNSKEPDSLQEKAQMADVLIKDYKNQLKLKNKLNENESESNNNLESSNNNNMDIDMDVEV